MKILQIIPGLEQGGAEIHLINLANELFKRGHEIIVAHSGGSLEKNLYDGIKISHLPVDRKNLFTGLYSAFKLENLNVDLIHVHSRVPAWIAWIVSSRKKIKWLMTAHAMYSLNAGIIPLKHADGVICVSEAVKNHLAGRISDLNTVIPNGIKIPDKKNSQPQNNIFLSVGRLTRLKCIDVALKALAQLKNYEWQYNIIGDGPQLNELKNLADELKISDRVKFHGAQNKNYVENLMLNSSCLLFPSNSEGMGLVVLEALSVGLPVIASDLEALRSISRGNLIEPENISKWKTAIENFILNRVSSDLDSKNIISIEQMTDLTEEFYKKVLAR